MPGDTRRALPTLLPDKTDRPRCPQGCPSDGPARPGPRYLPAPGAGCSGGRRSWRRAAPAALSPQRLGAAILRGPTSGRHPGRRFRRRLRGARPRGREGTEGTRGLRVRTPRLPRSSSDPCRGAQYSCFWRWLLKFAFFVCIAAFLLKIAGLAQWLLQEEGAVEFGEGSQNARETTERGLRKKVNEATRSVTTRESHSPNYMSIKDLKAWLKTNNKNTCIHLPKSLGNWN